MTTSSKFTISYDATNSEYSEHSIDALLLSDSIRAVVNMVTKADQVLNGEHSTVSLKVNAPAKQGSVQVGFEAVQLLANAVDVVKILGLTGAATGLLGGSVMAMVQHLKSQKVVELIEDKNTGKTTLITSKDDRHEVDSRIAQLTVDPTVRSALNTLIDKPFEGKEGAKFKILNDKDEAVVEVEGEETNNYTPLPARSLVESNVEEVDANITFTQVNFEGSTGWKMAYHGETPAVKMEDELFLKSVQENKANFSKDDMFSVKLSITRTKSPRGHSTKYKITKVTRHRVDANRKIIQDQ